MRKWKLNLKVPQKKCCLTYQCHPQILRKKCCLTYQSQHTPPKSLSQMSDVTSVQVPKSPSQLSTMIKVSTTLSVQVVGVQEGPKFQFLPLDDDQHMWLCKCVHMKNRVPSIKHNNVGQFLEGPPMHTKGITGDGNCLFHVHWPLPSQGTRWAIKRCSRTSVGTSKSTAHTLVNQPHFISSRPG